MSEDLQVLIFAEKERLSALRDAPNTLSAQLRGVLLSQEIRWLCEDYDLVTPFNEDSLRPAGYDLTVGARYAIRGVPETLAPDASLTIPPYQVAVIQTFETLNIPEFLIGRWNIRVKLAYQGLLWVGGAQVDPGFRGRLSCPIYNLSKEPVTLKYGERLAMIDFVTAGAPGSVPSKPFQWWNKSVVFQQYNTKLQSGVAEQVDKIAADLKSVESATRKHTDEQLQDAAKKSTTELQRVQGDFTNAIREVQGRIDSFLVLIFTVVSILFAGLGIVATKGSAEISFVSSTVWIAAVALYFACRPFVVIATELRRQNQPANHTTERDHTLYSRILPNVLEIGLAIIVVISSIGYHLWNAHISSAEIRNTSQAATDLKSTMVQQQRENQKELDQLRAEINALQKTIADTQQKSAKTKRP